MNKILKKVFVFYLLFFGFITYVNAQTYALNTKDVKNGEEVIPNISLVIGTYLFTDITKADTQSIMEASKTIVGDDVVIYQKLLDYSDLGDAASSYPYGMWIDAINGDEMVPANVNGLICITHLNGNQVSDPNCNATKFSVKFEGAIIEGGEKTVSIVNGEKIASADVPTPETKRGKKFVCWIDKEKEREYSSTDSCFKFDETIKNSVTLVPYYEDITYTIKFDMNGGTTNKPNDISCTLDEITTNNEKCKLPTISESRKGYTFNGWSSVKDESGEEGTHYDAGKQMTDKLGEENEITLYAVWTPILYTITYNLDGGTYEDQTVVKSSYNILVKDKIDLFTPTKVGYTFSGWDVINPSDSDKPTVDGPGDLSKYTLDVVDKTGDVTLKAKWLEKEYTITYDLGLDLEEVNASSNKKKYATLLADLAAPPNTTCKFATSCTLAEAPEREDFIFAGWADENGYLYSANKSYVGVDFPKSTVELTAQWNAKNEPLETIEYDLDKGNFPNGSFDKYGSKMLETVLPEPVKTGYTFAGWCADEGKTSDCKSTGAKIKDFLDDGVTLKELKLYAKWTPITYKVKFFEKSPALGISAQGVPGAGFDEITESEKECTYDTECDLTDHSEHFEEKKEKLYGWSLSYGEKNNNNSVYLSDAIKVKNLASTQDAEVDLYAVTKDLVYSITYYLDGGSFSSSDGPKSATKDEDVNIPDPTRDKYTFDGWYKLDGTKIEDSDRETEGTKVTVTENMVLVAKWHENIEYSLHIYLDGGKFDGHDDLTTKKHPSGEKVEIPTPTKWGYKFDKWVYEDGTDVTFDEDDKKLKMDSDKFLIAKWTKIDSNATATFAKTEDESKEFNSIDKDSAFKFNIKIAANGHKDVNVKKRITITKSTDGDADSEVSELKYGSQKDSEDSVLTLSDGHADIGEATALSETEETIYFSVKFATAGSYTIKIEIVDPTDEKNVLEIGKQEITVTGGEN